MKEHRKEDIDKIRSLHIDLCNLSKYSDETIEEAYSMYCQTFHAAGWTKVDMFEFAKWATRAPIDIISGDKK